MNGPIPVHARPVPVVFYLQKKNPAKRACQRRNMPMTTIARNPAPIPINHPASCSCNAAPIPPPMNMQPTKANPTFCHFTVHPLPLTHSPSGRFFLPNSPAYRLHSRGQVLQNNRRSRRRSVVRYRLTETLCYTRSTGRGRCPTEKPKAPAVASALRLPFFHYLVSTQSSTCAISTATCITADSWYQQEEQHEDNQEHHCPTGETPKHSSIVHGLHPLVINMTHSMKS
jgi:hypothetical protein